ncbi:MAG: hypothetical protein QM729_21350 [Solirubrobacterales bacterium]
MSTETKTITVRGVVTTEHSVEFEMEVPKDWSFSKDGFKGKLGVRLEDEAECAVEGSWDYSFEGFDIHDVDDPDEDEE